VETRQYLDLLWDALEKDLMPTIATQKDMVANGVITHDLLWSIMEQPGTLVFTKLEGYEHVM